MTGPELQEHKRISDDIDTTYLMALNGATGIRTYLSMPRGDTKSIYNNFHSPFTELFQHTYQLPDISKTVSVLLTENIKSWINYKPNFAHKFKLEQHMRAGLSLFDKYQKELLERGVINVSQK